MYTGWARGLCRLLIALMIWAPFQFAAAGMIAPDQGATGAQRAALVSQLEAFGVDAASAKERVAAMTDAEARTLAGEIASAPAGGVYGEGIIAIILISLIIYAWYKHRNPW